MLIHLGGESYIGDARHPRFRENWSRYRSTHPVQGLFIMEEPARPGLLYCDKRQNSSDYLLREMNTVLGQDNRANNAYKASWLVVFRKNYAINTMIEWDTENHCRREGNVPG